MAFIAYKDVIESLLGAFEKEKYAKKVFLLDFYHHNFSMRCKTLKRDIYRATFVISTRTMHTTLIDSDACAPKDGGVDEEAQTHETPRGEKTSGDWGPFVLLVFAFVPPRTNAV